MSTCRSVQATSTALPPRGPGCVVGSSNRTEMDCTEKFKLTEEHHLAAIAYSRAAKALNGGIWNGVPEETRKLRVAAGEARIKAAEARTALKLHRIEHGC